MEGSFIEQSCDTSRIQADRLLREYRRMNSILRSSRSYKRHFSEDDELDETTIHAQMYSIRAMILSVEDARERMFLYQYYVKGHTLEICAKLIGVSIRTVGRVKLSALNTIACKMKIQNGE